MVGKYLIDTSIVIKYLDDLIPVPGAGFLDKELSEAINISIITKVEVLAWNPPDPRELVKFEQFVAAASVLHITDEIAAIATKIRKVTKVKLMDVFIAATAIAYSATLIADNDKDFNKIESLNIGFKYLNPFSIL